MGCLGEIMDKKAQKIVEEYLIEKSFNNANCPQINVVRMDGMATEQDIEEMLEQLKAVSWDPNLTIVT